MKNDAKIIFVFISPTTVFSECQMSKCISICASVHLCIKCFCLYFWLVFKDATVHIVKSGLLVLALTCGLHDTYNNYSGLVRQVSRFVYQCRQHVMHVSCLVFDGYSHNIGMRMPSAWILGWGKPYHRHVQSQRCRGASSSLAHLSVGWSMFKQAPLPEDICSKRHLKTATLWRKCSNLTHLEAGRRRISPQPLT